MNTTSSNKTSKTPIIILALLLVGTLIYSFKMYQDSEATALLLENEKIEVLKNLENMTSLYSEANADNEVANEKLIEAQTRLDSLMKELKTSKLTVSALLKYKRKYFEMESEMEVLLEENATLKFQNTLLETSLDSTQVQLSTQVASNTKLEAQNQRLSESVEAAKKLTVERLNAYGVIQRRSGKLVPTTRASRVDNLRICYSVPSNVLTASGDKNYLVQVIDPNLNVIGSNTPVQFEETILKYSYVSAFTYDNELLDVCDFVSAEEGDYEKGVYTVNIFDQQTLVASSTFTLK
ncbi:MAG: chromosome partitioning protein ParA [Flavobacteriaceae bacterium]|nr:chromosome partitioning protein ParA [Flavobacteriaceae bacterium]